MWTVITPVQNKIGNLLFCLITSEVTHTLKLLFTNHAWTFHTYRHLYANCIHAYILKAFTYFKYAITIAQWYAHVQAAHSVHNTQDIKWHIRTWCTNRTTLSQTVHQHLSSWTGKERTGLHNLQQIQEVLQHKMTSKILLIICKVNLHVIPSVIHKRFRRTQYGMKTFVA